MFHGVLITKPGKLMWQVLFKSFDPGGRMRLYFNNLFVSGDIIFYEKLLQLLNLRSTKRNLFKL